MSVQCFLTLKGKVCYSLQCWLSVLPSASNPYQERSAYLSFTMYPPQLGRLSAALTTSHPRTLARCWHTLCEAMGKMQALVSRMAPTRLTSFAEKLKKVALLLVCDR